MVYEFLQISPDFSHEISSSVPRPQVALLFLGALYAAALRPSTATAVALRRCAWPRALAMRGVRRSGGNVWDETFHISNIRFL